MGTLNISSMDLRAVNVSTHKSGSKKRRPKFTTKKISTAQKIAMGFGAAALLAAAVLLPPAPLERVMETEKPDAARAVLPEQAVKRLSSSDVASSRIAFAEPIVEKASGLEPLSMALPFAPTTPSETAIALQVLAKYTLNGSADQKKEAQVWMGELRKDHLNEALPNLIRTHETVALGVFAKLAAEKKVPGAVSAIIDRLNSKSKLLFAQDELLQALTAFGNEPEVQSYFDRALEGVEPLRSRTWNVLGDGMSEKHVNLALQRVLNGSSDADSAAKALGRHAKTPQSANALLSLTNKYLQDYSVDKQIRFAGLLGEIEKSTASPRLRMLAVEQNELIRAAAVRAMSRNPDNSDVIVAMLKQDTSLLVKKAAMAALAQSPNETALGELIVLLNDESLRASAKKALVAANNGKDLGWQEIEWQAWLEHR